MQVVQLLKLDGNPIEFLDSLECIFSSLKKVTISENNLRSYLIASTMLDCIYAARDMLERHGTKYYCYSVEPQIYRFEDSDSIEQIMRIKLSYNPIAAYA